MTYYVHFESPDMCEGCLLYILLVVLRKMKRKNLNLNQSLCVVETDSEEDCSNRQRHGNPQKRSTSGRKHLEIYKVLIDYIC